MDDSFDKFSHCIIVLRIYGYLIVDAVITSIISSHSFKFAFGLGSDICGKFILPSVVHTKEYLTPFECQSDNVLLCPGVKG